jgi:hypothetical protein
MHRHDHSQYEPQTRRCSIVADLAKAKMGSSLGAREETHMPTSVKQLIEAANAVVPKIAPAQAREMMAKGNTLVVDVRDAPELEKSGKIAGAVHHSRGMLEFRADPEHDEYRGRQQTY